MTATVRQLFSDAVINVLRTFPGAKIVEIRGGCEYCARDHIPEWCRGGKLVERTWPAGRREWVCHYCGRNAEREKF